MLSSAHVSSRPALIWVRVLPASTPSLATGTGVSVLAEVPVPELAVAVTAPAIRCAGTVQGTGLVLLGADLGEGLTGQHATGIDGHRQPGISLPIRRQAGQHHCCPSNRPGHS